jgi:hypothetical protein
LPLEETKMTDCYLPHRALLLNILIILDNLMGFSTFLTETLYVNLPVAELTPHETFAQ